MRIHLVLWLLFIAFCLITLSINTLMVTDSCLGHQKSLLLHLRNELHFDPASRKLVQWHQSTDCCEWNGVVCHEGRVTGLDLSEESISGGIDTSSSLFKLEYLQSLNLANNYFESAFPSGFHRLQNLKHLNLSYAGFLGQIPIDISQLTSLLTPDLSMDIIMVGALKVQIADLPLLIQNLTAITELYLDNINISASGNEWCHALTSSLPNLRVLSLAGCNLRGPLDSSLAKLKNLTILDLKNNKIGGKFPEQIFQLEKLTYLDVSKNEDLQGSLPDFSQNVPLQTLLLWKTNFSGPLPHSISNLRHLSKLDLSNCQFSGRLPSSLSKLTKLVSLDLSSNNFIGPLPSFNISKTLTHLYLFDNHFNGSIPSTHFHGLHNLVEIKLEGNSLCGPIPSSIFNLPSVEWILLSENHFDGQLDDVIKTSSRVRYIDLSNNHLEGPVPLSLFQLTQLRYLLLSFNKLSGEIDLNMFRYLRNLTSLDLSYNNLSIIDAITTNPSLPSFPTLGTLGLASCGLTKIPQILKNQSRLFILDLSSNDIGGTIPLQILNTTTLNFLNLSQNHFTDLEQPSQSNTPYLNFLELHSNQLHNLLPTLPPLLGYLDYSNNKLSSVIPPSICNQLNSVIFLSLSNNNFHGSIPESICNIASHLEALDLSDNSLTGTIPKCLIAMNGTLSVLNLGRNKLSGHIDTLPGSCALRTLVLNGNSLTGKLPKFLASCKMLEVLDLGNNKINDNFPCWLKQMFTLRVLILRSNRLNGSIDCPRTQAAWSSLQIVDLASNNFDGRIPVAFFKAWKAMMVDQDDKAVSNLNYLQVKLKWYAGTYFQDKVTVTSKGLQRELVRINTIFTSIDLSCNRFNGAIPEELGQLKALHILNLSHNAFSGHIPSSLGNLKQLESLDLSNNSLNSQIPTQLASLSFLSVLNLSFNHLVGKIPTGTQLQSFNASCFEGNKGLYGPPLTQSCNGDGVPGMSLPASGKSHSDTESPIDWNFLCVELGFTLGLGLVILPLIFWTWWRMWYCKLVDDLLYRIFPQLDFVHEHREGKNYRTLRWKS